MTDMPRVHPTVVHMLADTAARAPDREALVCDGERLTYAQYLGSVAKFAHELIDRGARGERVALMLGNGIDICIAMFAVHAAGATTVVSAVPLAAAPLASIGPPGNSDSAASWNNPSRQRKIHTMLVSKPSNARCFSSMSRRVRRNWLNAGRADRGRRQGPRREPRGRQ